MKVTPTPQNNIQLALDIRRGQWLVSDAEALLPIALEFLAHIPPRLEALDFTPMAYAEAGAAVQLDSNQPQKKKCVATIPINGTITKYNTCGTIGTSTVAAELLKIAADDRVAGIVLDIDSGGGAVNAIPIMVEAIHKVQAMGKPIVAHCDLCGSAAYWIASQCDSIFADNALSYIGSIGVMTQIVDDRQTANGGKVVSIYAKESTDKNLSYRNALEGNYELLQTELSSIVHEFHAAVKAGRPSLQADAAGVLSGAMFRAEEARNVGLIDNLLTLDATVENVFARVEYR